MRPLSELPSSHAAAVEILATDVDGTLTTDARLSAAVLTRLEQLSRAGVEVIPVSGRPAGEILALSRYLPGVSRAVAENGMVALAPDAPTELLVPKIARATLMDAAKELASLDPRPLVPAPDAFCRLADLAFERDGRDHALLERFHALAKARGLCLVWSNVHIHISGAPPDKGAGLLRLLGEGVDPQKVAVIGDAPNDAGLFTPGRFGVSVGTAQVQETAKEFEHLPAYVTQEAEAAGFCAFADRLLRARES